MVGDTIVDDILINGNQFFKPTDEEFFMPLEFAVAAYRFGHSMVRTEYEFNVYVGAPGAQDRGTLDLLFTFTALSGQLGGFDTLPQNRIIQWENCVDSVDGNGQVLLANNPTRNIDTRLVEPLFELRAWKGIHCRGPIALPITMVTQCKIR